MPALFYQRYWDILGNDMCALCLKVLNGCDDVASFDHTLVALIPKVCSPTRVSEFCPISFCNVIYKLISKILANRLKRVLPATISEFQSAFIRKRMILDNVLAAFETIHCLMIVPLSLLQVGFNEATPLHAKPFTLMID